MAEKKDHDDYASEEASSQAESFDASKSGTSETYDMKDFCPGIRIEAKDFDGKWYPAKVSDVDWTENEILVHFENWNTKFDEWIPMDSSRLRPIQKPVSQQKDVVKFSKGEAVMAVWSANQKYPGVIQAVLANDRYDVLFSDGFLKRLKGHKISKVQGEVIKSEIKTFSDIGTKEERRERKRKINVAELFHVNKRSKKKGLVSSKSQDIKTYPVSKSKTKSSLTKKPDNIEENLQKAPITEIKDVKQNEEKPGFSNISAHNKSLLDNIPATFEVKYLNGEVEIWTKQLYQRSEGRTAGKLDIVILNPQGRKFRSRNEIMKYCEENGIVYSHEAFDFSAKGRPKSKPVIQTPPLKTELSTDDKEKLSGKKGIKKPPVDALMGTSISQGIPSQNDVLPLEVTTPNKVFIGDYEVVIENGKFICPVKVCAKHFRRENLLHMHMKHYHPEFSKYLDYTPSVTDLAYARTVGNLDAVEIPPPVPRKISGPSDKLEKSAVKSEPTRRTSDVFSEPTKEAKKLKIVDMRNHSTKPLDVSPVPVSAEGPNDENSKNKVSPLALQLGKSTLNENNNEFHKTSENLLAGPSNEQNPRSNDTPTVASSSTIKPKHSRLPSRKKSSRFQGSFSEHIRKRRFLSQDRSRVPKPGRQQQSQVPVNVPQTPSAQPTVSPQPYVENTNTNTNNLNQGFTVARYLKPHLSVQNEISDTAEVTEDSKSPIGAENDKVEKLRRNEIINCLCGVTEEDGLMIQCDICLCWQHGHCAGILKELDVPDKYTCAICKNPYRGRSSMKYLYDQEWLKEGTLPSLSFRSKRNEIHEQRKAVLKRSHDLSGSITLLAQVIHSLRIKVNIAEKKDHPKLWLWAKKWTEKKPSRVKEELEVKEEKPEENLDLENEVKKEGCVSDEKQLPKAPEPEAPIDSAECRLNLLDHLIHYQSLIDARLSCIESLVAELESMQDDAVNDETPDRYPRTNATVKMILRDLNTMKKIASI